MFCGKAKGDGKVFAGCRSRIDNNGNAIQLGAVISFLDTPIAFYLTHDIFYAFVDYDHPIERI
jgi:hypothetical protein